MINCKSCHASTKSIIPLGCMPLANALLEQAGNENKYNLEVMLCDSCGLAQLSNLIEPGNLFNNYIYFSSNSDTMLESAKCLVDEVSNDLDKNVFIIEIASNDGYLLRNYVSKGFRVLGIEPAKNICKIANENNIPTLCAFFSDELAKTLVIQNKKADIIHANNVMAHVPDINGFIAGIKKILKPKGKAIIEVPYFLDLFNNLEFDTIYHEHVYYFSVKPLKILFNRYDLEIYNIEKLIIHGGTLRLFVSHKGRYNVKSIVDKMILNENKVGLYYDTSFNYFKVKVDKLKKDILELLNNIKKQNKKIAAYGASAKGTTLLNYFGINKDQIDFIVDRSSAKTGLLAPGTQLLIKPTTALIDEKVDYALLLAWNFTDEIIKQQQEYISNGGKFIIPLPIIKVIP